MMVMRMSPSLTPPLMCLPGEKTRERGREGYITHLECGIGEDAPKQRKRERKMNEGEGGG
jgi:hypothetical protein